jgi:putative heme iron utilization protein
VRIEPHVQPKGNLAVAGQRVDTRVLQVLYALPKGLTRVFTGQQLDVFVNRLERVQP